MNQRQKVTLKRITFNSYFIKRLSVHFNIVAHFHERNSNSIGLMSVANLAAIFTSLLCTGKLDKAAANVSSRRNRRLVCTLAALVTNCQRLFELRADYLTIQVREIEIFIFICKYCLLICIKSVQNGRGFSQAAATTEPSQTTAH